MDFGKEEATELFKTMLDERVGTVVNKAVTDHLQRSQKKFTDQVIERVQEVVSEEFDARGTDGKEGGKGKEPAATSQDSKRITDLETKLAEAETTAATSRKREALATALKGQRIEGLSSFTIDGILASVEDSDGALFVGDTSLDDWAKEFARTDEGKRYIPAKNRGGTGAQPGTHGGEFRTSDGGIDLAASLKADLESLGTI